MHGCTQPAEEFVDEWSPFAAANRMVMVFPQAKMCWDNMAPGLTTPNFITTEGPQMLFLKAIVENAQKPLLKERDFDYKQKNMEPKSAYKYPEDFYTNGLPQFAGQTVEVDCHRWTTDKGELGGRCDYYPLNDDGTRKQDDTEVAMKEEENIK